MKKAKFMLIAIAVLATVGGALAFKTSQKFTSAYCYRTSTVPNSVTTTCTAAFDGDYKTKTTETTGLTTYYYTLKVGSSCTDGEICNVSSTLVAE